jgi:predicted nuclease of predicted toxin-antitoxin system
MDVHVPFAITLELRLRAVDVLTAQEDGGDELEDSKLLDRASGLGRVLVTQDIDLLREAARRRETSRYFLGIVYAPQLQITINQAVSDLELIANATTPEEWVCRVEYLPLK